MDHSPSLPGTPGAAPLQPLTPDRVNQQRESKRESTLVSSTRSGHSRDSSIHDKIQQFNSMSHLGQINPVSMSKQLERKTADAALKRAMVGREEAETEMRRYREEARALRRQIEEGRERERKVGERLETVMENYGRAKETYSHTQSLWEKEIRRARKETFKSQSTIVKLQEELKTAKNASKSVEEVLEREKERSKSREQEAFNARYQLVGLQEQLDQALERIKLVEQERDAFKTLAKNEEVARIAAEGQLPLPRTDGSEEEFASPKKERTSLSAIEIVSSAASEAEIEELTSLWQWEKQRADRTQEHLEFLQAECHLRCCPCAKARPKRSAGIPGRKQRSEPVAIVDAADLMIMGQKPESPEQPLSPGDDTVIHQPLAAEVEIPITTEQRRRSKGPKGPREPRRSAIFLPSEGIFRTISQEDLEAMESVKESKSKENTPMPVETGVNPKQYARTPSVEPPTFALMIKERTSLLSLLNAPRQSDVYSAPINIPTTPHVPIHQQESEQLDADADAPDSPERPEPPNALRPHTSAAFYTVTTTTTVPVRDENIDPNGFTRGYGHRTPSFDITNPALTPTMTREQALAQIRERRGRARSAAQGAMTPRRQMVVGVNGDRRQISAPAGRVKGGSS